VEKSPSETSKPPSSETTTDAEATFLYDTPKLITKQGIPDGQTLGPRLGDLQRQYQEGAAGARILRSVGQSESDRFDTSPIRDTRLRESPESIDTKIFGGGTSDSRGSTESTAQSASDDLQTILGSSSAAAGSAAEKNSLARGAIVKWAEDNGRLISKIPYRLGGSRDIGGSEHHVFLEKKDDRVVKITKGSGDNFGNTLCLIAKDKTWRLGPANALQYLTRNQLSNSAFTDDIRLHAVFQDKMGNVNIVTSQPIVKGDHIQYLELSDKMEAAGFKPLTDGEGSAFHRASDNLLILDSSSFDSLPQSGHKWSAAIPTRSLTISSSSAALSSRPASSMRTGWTSSMPPG